MPFDLQNLFSSQWKYVSEVMEQGTLAGQSEADALFTSLMLGAYSKHSEVDLLICTYQLHYLHMYTWPGGYCRC